MKKIISIFILLGLIFTVFSCGKKKDNTNNNNNNNDKPVPTIDSISDITLYVDDVYTISPVAHNIESPSYVVSFDSESGILGLVGMEITALYQGTIRVTVSLLNNESVSTSFNVTINENPPVKNPSITISGDNEVTEGDDLVLTANVIDLDGNVNWSVDDSSLASIDQNGKLTAIKEGTVLVTASIGEYSDEMSITINKKQPTGSLTITGELETYVSKYTKLTCTKNNVTGSVAWKSSDKSIATVSVSGSVKGISVGTVEITATVGDISVTVTVTIKPLPSVTITGAVESIKVGNQLQLGYELDLLEGEVTWSSSNEQYATVDKNGLVTPVGEGTVKIKASIGEFMDEVTIKVKAFSFDISYDYNGGYSQSLYLANKNSAPSYALNNYNAINGGFWSRYTTDVFIGDKNNHPNATFSDRIFIKKNTETGFYEICSIVVSGSAPWPSNAEYVISISHSYSKYAANIKPVTDQLHVGMTVVFDGDFKQAADQKFVNAYFFDGAPSTTKLSLEFTGSSVLDVPTRLGFDFVGWYDSDNNLYDEASDIKGDVALKAKWQEKNPVTGINVSSIPDEMVTNETQQIIASVAPTDAYFKDIFYKSSNTNIIKVDENGVLTAINAGTATITIYDYMKKVEYNHDIIVYEIKSIDVNFQTEFMGTLEIGENISLAINAYGKGLTNSELANACYNFISLNTEIASVDANGVVTGNKEGLAHIKIELKDDPSLNITIGITVHKSVEETRVDQLLELLLSNHFNVVETGNVCLYNDGTEKVFVPTYGSVNRFLFADYVVNTTRRDAYSASNHTKRRACDTIEFVTVHDTATLTGTVVDQADYFKVTNAASIHYTVGDNEIYAVVPESLIAWHAGDGTSKQFSWVKTNAVATDNVAPVITVVNNNGSYYLAVNGERTSVSVPNFNDRAPKTSDLTRLGPVWKVENGYYYVGSPLWYSSYGNICSFGGNCNSIGIEMCVNKSGDIYDTWQRTAQLVADILIRNGLDTTRVKMHNTWSGKNCPQCLIEANYWWDFMEMVEINYEIMKNYSDAEISMKSNNENILDNTGRIIKQPKTTTTVSYELTIKIGSTTKTITLSSIVPGTTTWEQWNGTYSAKVIWNDGNFVR